MNCPACKKKTTPKDLFCRYCGAPLTPGSQVPIREEARHSFQSGDYAQALRLLKAELKRKPKDAELVSWTGHAYFLSGKESEAVEAYRSALGLDPSLWDARYQLASIDFSRGDFSKAAEGFAQVAESRPEIKGHPLEAIFGGSNERVLASAWLYAGLAHKELGQSATAAEALKKASALDPENPLAYGVKADMLMAAEQFEEAAFAYERALSKVRDESGLLALRNDLGVALFRAGKLERAAEEFKKVIQKDPHNDNAIYNLGVLYLRQGLSEDMKHDLREFLKADEAEHILLGLTRSIAEAASRQQGESERGGILGSSKPMLEVLDLIRRAGASDATVLILGENGTGKELVARAIHLNSPRKDKPFVAVNCGALPDTLLESELFGYERGAFTGAATSKPGRFELANGGTLFLDEIGDLEVSVQVKLLRAIQEKTFERLGGTKTFKSDIRIIAATHRDLRAKVLSGEFREDLFYRLYVVPINLPPLRERKEDIALLAQHFLERNALKTGKRFARITQAALSRLNGHSWPGNVRELENVIERAVAIFDDVELKPEHLRFDVSAPREQPESLPAPASAPAPRDLAGAEKDVILRQLEQSQFRVNEAAKALGLSRATLYRKMQKYQISAS